MGGGVKYKNIAGERKVTIGYFDCSGREIAIGDIVRVIGDDGSDELYSPRIDNGEIMLISLDGNTNHNIVDKCNTYIYEIIDMIE